MPIRSPRISVIQTSFNLARFLPEAIDGVLAQTFSDFELIIWDDASEDSSWEIITAYTDPRIRAFRNPQRMRASWGINRAIREVARGEFIAINHADDVWEPAKLERQVAFLDAHPDVAAVFTNAEAIDEAGAPLANRNHFYASIFSQPNRTRHEWLNHFYFQGNALCHPSLLIRASCYTECGLYQTALTQLCDFDMWVRLCMRHEVHVLPEKLVRFRVRDDESNVSGNRPEARIRAHSELFTVLDHYFKLVEFEEFARIFPQADKFRRPDGFEVRFVLAMIALESEAGHVVHSHAVLALIKLLLDAQTARRIHDLYGFDHHDLIAITGQRDVFLLEHAQQTGKQQLHALELEWRLQAILQSRSWRCTAPLRWVMTQFRRLANPRFST